MPVDPNDLADLFTDGSFGHSLDIYVAEDVPDRDQLVQLIKKYGGTVVPGYSSSPYLLVDARKRSGRNLYHQFARKKGKIVLDYRWPQKCIETGKLQTFAQNWAGCKVNGTETETPEPPRQQPTIHAPLPQQHSQQHFTFQSFVPAAAQQWQPPSEPPQPPLISPNNNYSDERTWNQYAPQNATASSSPFDYSRYRQDESSGWHPDNSYYEPSFAQSYQPTYEEEEEEDSPPVAGPSSRPVEPPARGRARVRPSTPAPPASSLVANRRAPARSPSPPTRVVKSTYGGNLFTADDVLYLKNYIKYCHEQGLVLSLREICERIAIKAPHHTFFSWRRYCNKHQIRLGGYQMSIDPSTNASEDSVVVDPPPPPASGSVGPNRALGDATASAPPRNRSPSPPRSLFRSTTGKGVAFTDEDVTFLIRFLAYRKSQGKLDMVAFWKDVAAKAPHHSRASWMKYWRRHKHEFEAGATGVPVAQPPAKKLRYGRADDIVLARYFMTKRHGTLDVIFQQFAQTHPSHPWKGWQEHYRIHKGRIELLQERLLRGEILSETEDEGL
uniref:BRCT domain-containing protein n=1 Tax=Mycena chlorophos TaxID=658473 RepID=A0ABQ0M4C2_MYCCL|nr:predicted protein [Mycena chlorophos]